MVGAFIDDRATHAPDAVTMDASHTPFDGISIFIISAGVSGVSIRATGYVTVLCFQKILPKVKGPFSRVGVRVRVRVGLGLG